jgi:hypothetical protein
MRCDVDKYERLIYLDGRQRLWVEVAWNDNGIRRAQRMAVDFEQDAIQRLDAFKAELDRVAANPVRQW